jgi:hypothetical protein
MCGLSVQVLRNRTQITVKYSSASSEALHAEPLDADHTVMAWGVCVAKCRCMKSICEININIHTMPLSHRGTLFIIPLPVVHE